MNRNWDMHDAEVSPHRNQGKTIDSGAMFFGGFFVCRALIWMFSVWVQP
jgi:hypothetical protein